MTESQWRQEVALLFASRRSVQFELDHSDGLAELAQQADLPDATSLVRQSLDWAREFATANELALIDAILGYVMAVPPTLSDQRHLEDANRASAGRPKRSAGDYDQLWVRNAWAYMRYRRAQGASPSRGFHEKNGRLLRPSMEMALSRALERVATNPGQLGKFIAARDTKRAVDGTFDYPRDHEENRTSGPGIDRSHFVSQHGPVDGSLLPIGKPFTMRWRIQNSGNVDWIGRRLRRMQPQRPELPASPDYVDLPATFPGQTIDIEVDFVAPRVQGYAVVNYKMVDRNDDYCFPNRYSSGLGISLMFNTVEFIERRVD